MDDPGEATLPETVKKVIVSYGSGKTFKILTDARRAGNFGKYINFSLNCCDKFLEYFELFLPRTMPITMEIG